MLEAHRRNPALIEERRGVVGLAVLLQRRGQQHRRSAVGGPGGQRLHRAAAGGKERAAQHQILRRITGDEQFRERNQIGSLARRFRAGFPRLCNVRVNSANGRVELGKRDLQAVGHDGWCLSRRNRAGNGGC